jgi:hypothetical protein
MTYQEILKANLSRRIGMNPRYSLRAFAQLVGLSPSKLSEIFSAKKGLSSARAEDVCARLKLKGPEKEAFLLSVEAQHSRIEKVRVEAKRKLKEIAQLSISGRTKTAQRNAWYFGACKAVKEAGLKTGNIEQPLGLTALQVENAERFVGRISKLHPDRERFSYEPASVFKKLSEDYSTGSLSSLDAEFAFLTEDQARALGQLIRDKICSFASEARDRERASLYMFFIGHSELCKKEELC